MLVLGEGNTNAMAYDSVTVTNWALVSSSHVQSSACDAGVTVRAK